MNDSTPKTILLRLTELRYQLLPTLFERLKGDDRALGQILQCHLFAEVILEELIKLALGRQAEAVLSVRLTFDQKLSIVSKLKFHEDWELLPDYVIGSLRKLNSLRNRLAHRYGEQVLEEQVRELFVGLEEELPYSDILEHGLHIAISRYAAFIFGHMLPKYEKVEDKPN